MQNYPACKVLNIYKEHYQIIKIDFQSYSNESDISIFEVSIYQQTKSKVDFFGEKRFFMRDVQN